MMFLNARFAKRLFGDKTGSKPSALEDPLLRPNWDLFRGPNFRTIGSAPFRVTGPIRTAHHIGKPLSAELWEDVFFRFGARALVVYEPSHERYPDVFCDGLVEIWVGQGDLVKDINFWSHAWER